MTRKHYHVLVGSEGGYLPDTYYMATSKQQAEAIAADEARYIVNGEWESEEDHPHKSGSARSGLIVIDTGRSLDTIIEVVPCQEADCLEGEN